MALKDIRSNILRLTDSYNTFHQFAKENTDWETSHFYNRKQGMILYGFQEIVTDLLSTKITHAMIDEVVPEATQQRLPFPEQLFRSVVDDLNGNIPLKVDMLPEGTWVPAGTPFAQISNTEKGYGELVTWWEGPMMHAYFPSACATEAFHMRRYLDSLGLSNTRFHSFGFRGHKSLEDSYWTGTAFALCFEGTDDFHIKHHVPNANLGSIPALAHKVTQQFDNEYDCFIRTIDQTAALGLSAASLVIDTYDANRFINEYLVSLANYGAERGIHEACRPDSGDVIQQTVDIYNMTVKHDLKNVSVLIGEGIDFETAKAYDRRLKAQGVPLEFVSYGVGAGFYKNLERDTLGWAMKTAYSNGAPRMKFGMDTLKRSIPGVVGLSYDDNGDMVVKPEAQVGWYEDLYQSVYFSSKSVKSPEVVQPNWDHTFKGVQNLLGKGNLQRQIVLSDSILELSQEIAKKHNTTLEG